MRRNLVALPGLEPGLFALRGRRVNQLHHNAKLLIAGGYPLQRTHRIIASLPSKLNPSKASVAGEFNIPEILA